MSSPNSVASRLSAGGSKIGRPAQWTIPRSRRLARLYVYTDLSIEKIIRVLGLGDDQFKPRKNSAQKTVHDMLDNDPRYLRPGSRWEMLERITTLSASPSHRRSREDQSVSEYSSELRDETDRLPVIPDIPEENGIDGAHVTWEQTSYGDMSDDVFDGIVAMNTPATDCSFDVPPCADQPRFVPKPLTRRSTMLSSMTEHSTASLQELRKVASGYSNRCLRHVQRVLKHFTISEPSDANGSPFCSPMEYQLPSLLSTPPVVPDLFAGHAGEDQPHPGLATAGDLMNPEAYNFTCSKRHLHDARLCWCSITDAVGREPDAWFLPTGDLSPRGHTVLAAKHWYPQVSIPRDKFGNTPLHLAASMDGYQEALFKMISYGADMRITNAANQTFLHLLAADWFDDFSSPTHPLRRLIAIVHKSCSHLMFAKDHYGRTFFHRLYKIVDNNDLSASLISAYYPLESVVLDRDAFGFNPLERPTMIGPFAPPRRVGTLTPLPENSPISPATEADALLYHHTRLVQILQEAHENPEREDAEGRNGLHCLAEAIIDQAMLDEQRTVMSTGRPLKRKYNKKDEPEGTKSPLARRLEILRVLLTPSAGGRVVNINHYDRRGNTVLAAFVAHVPDEHDDKAKSLAAVFETLAQAGADIEARNRRAETPLLVAARLGRKLALAFLLEHGANVHARDADGRGVLEIIDAHLRGRAAREDVKLYARLEACRALLTHSKNRNWGVVHRPTVVQEWAAREEVKQ